MEMLQEVFQDMALLGGVMTFVDFCWQIGKALCKRLFVKRDDKPEGKRKHRRKRKGKRRK